jgi:hypothetical protein
VVVVVAPGAERQFVVVILIEKLIMLVFVNHCIRWGVCESQCETGCESENTYNGSIVTMLKKKIVFQPYSIFPWG